MPSPKLCGSVPAYRSLRRVSFRSIPSAPLPAWSPRGGGTLFARVSCVRARARPRASCAGAVRAPDCARETAGACPPFVPAGAFFGPSHCFPAQKSRKAAPEAASLPSSYTTFSQVKPPGGRNMKIFPISCRKPVGGVGGRDDDSAASPPVRRRSRRAWFPDIRRCPHGRPRGRGRSPWSRRRARRPRSG